MQTCVARAWDFAAGKPLVVAPAMNTHMWRHPLTAKHIAVLEDIGCSCISPVTKTLACGDHGIGAMEDVDSIARQVKRKATSYFITSL